MKLYIEQDLVRQVPVGLIHPINLEFMLKVMDSMAVGYTLKQDTLSIFAQKVLVDEYSMNTLFAEVLDLLFDVEIRYVSSPGDFRISLTLFKGKEQ